MPDLIPDAQFDFAALARRTSDLSSRRIRVAVPAKVLSFSAAKATVSCQALIDEPLPEGGHLADAVFQEVPVLYPGSATAAVRWPLAAGDTVLVVFLDRAADSWILSLLQPEAVSPKSHQPAERRWHDVSDAVALPICTRSPPNLPVPSGAVDVRFGGAASPALQVTGSAVKLGAAASQAVVRGDLYRTNEDVLFTAFVVAIKAALSALGLSGPSSALDVAKAAFDAQKLLYLSQIAKTE